MAAAKLYLAAHLGDHLGERHRSFQDVFRLRLEGTVHGGTVGKRLAPNALPRAHVVPRPDDATFEVGSAADPRSRKQYTGRYRGSGMHPAARPHDDGS